MLGDFLTAEDGAVTVDWVVMTAALVGLGLATSSLVSRGVETQTRAIESFLDGGGIIRTSFDAVLENVTAAFTADTVKSAGSEFSELRNQTAFSFQLDATLAADDEGILFEAGGRGDGTILYQHDGVLYLQSGKGNGYGEAANRGEAVWTVADGSYSIEGSLDADAGLALYVDGALVSQSSFSNGRLAGGDAAAVGEGTNSVAVNRGGFVKGDGHPGAGDMSVFLDQTTGDI